MLKNYLHYNTYNLFLLISLNLSYIFLLLNALKLNFKYSLLSLIFIIVLYYLNFEYLNFFITLGLIYFNRNIEIISIDRYYNLIALIVVVTNLFPELNIFRNSENFQYAILSYIFIMIKNKSLTNLILLIIVGLLFDSKIILLMNFVN